MASDKLQFKDEICFELTPYRDEDRAKELKKLADENPEEFKKQWEALPPEYRDRLREIMEAPENLFLDPTYSEKLYKEQDRYSKYQETGDVNDIPDNPIWKQNARRKE